MFPVLADMLKYAEEKEKRQLKEELENEELYWLLERDATKLRLEQYEKGEITRQKLVDYTYKRICKQLEKRTAKQLEKLNVTQNRPETITIITEWRKNGWGWCPTVSVFFNNIKVGREYAGGCGYDKESAALGAVLNKQPGILHLLYAAKESAINNDTFESNRTTLGYGSGYDVLPAFEGGVGVSCHLSILEDVGYKVTSRLETNDTVSVYTLQWEGKGTTNDSDN